MEDLSVSDGKSLCTDSQCTSCYASTQTSETDTDLSGFIIKDHSSGYDSSYVESSVDQSLLDTTLSSLYPSTASSIVWSQDD